MQKSKVRRDGAVELYRILLMFGIVFLHSCGNTGEPSSVYLDRMLRACVPGFIFITGWFGLKFSVRKIVALYGIAAYSACVASIFGWLILDVPYSLCSIVEMVRNYWFLNGYVMLMLLAPLVNLAINEVSKSQMEGCHLLPHLAPLIPVCGLTFGWCFLHQVSGIARVMPLSSGIQSFSGLMMLGVYVAGRLSRIICLDEQLSAKYICLMFGVGLSLTICGHGFECYASPGALLSSAGFFFVIKRMKWARKIGDKLLWVCPSLFSVYLMHAHKVPGFEIFAQLKQIVIGYGMPDLVVWTLSSLIVFTVCLALDTPRRLFVYAISRSYK